MLQRRRLADAALPQPQVGRCQAAQQPLPDDFRAPGGASEQHDRQDSELAQYLAAAEQRERQQDGDMAEYWASKPQEWRNDGAMAQYAQLKDDMNRTTRRFAAFIGGYLLLTTTSDVSAQSDAARGYQKVERFARK